MNTPEHYEQDVLSFFDGKPTELDLYETLFQKLDTQYSEAAVKVQKTQISFYGKCLFAAASVPTRRKKGWPKTCLMVTIGLGHEKRSPRIAVATEPYPGRWTHHILIERPEQIDEELLEWFREAYDFAERK